MNLQLCMESPQILVNHIEHYILTQTGKSIRDLEVDVSGKTVRITGQTTSFYNKQLVTHIVRDSLSDVALKNDIVVSK